MVKQLDNILLPIITNFREVLYKEIDTENLKTTITTLIQPKADNVYLVKITILLKNIKLDKQYSYHINHYFSEIDNNIADTIYKMCFKVLIKCFK